MSLIDELDREALAAAQRAFGTTTTADTLNAALRQVAKQDRRQQALDREFGPERAEQYAQLEDRDSLWR